MNGGIDGSLKRGVKREVGVAARVWGTKVGLGGHHGGGSPG